MKSTKNVVRNAAPRKQATKKAPPIARLNRALLEHLNKLAKVAATNANCATNGLGELVYRDEDEQSAYLRGQKLASVFRHAITVETLVNRIVAATEAQS